MRNTEQGTGNIVLKVGAALLCSQLNLQALSTDTLHIAHSNRTKSQICHKRLISLVCCHMLRKKLQIKLMISSSHSIMISVLPGIARSPCCLTSGRLDSRVPYVKLLM